MIQLQKISFFLTFFLSLHLTAEVTKSDDITSIKPYVHKQALLILDLDDTVIRSKTTLGNPACFYKLREYFIAQEILSKNETIQAMCVFDSMLQKHIEFSLVDDRIRELIDHYQDQEITVIGLTSRPPLLSDVTYNILKKLKIHLGQNIPLARKEFCLNGTALYDHGVLYVGDHNAKSAVLDYFIRQLSPKDYTTIIFADDKEMYVRDLENYAEQNGYDFFGLYYVKEKARQRTINIQLALEQLKRLIVLSEDPLKETRLTTEIKDPFVLKMLFGDFISLTSHYYLQGMITPDEECLLDELESNQASSFESHLEQR